MTIDTHMEKVRPCAGYLSLCDCLVIVAELPPALTNRSGMQLRFASGGRMPMTNRPF